MWHYVIIPLVTIGVALAGGQFTGIGLKSWYKTLKLPAWTPGGWLIGMVWTVLYILATLSAILFWNKSPHDKRFWIVIGIFLINAFLNAFWNYLFFAKHLLDAAFWECIILDLTIIALIILIWPVSKLAASLLIPYALWVAFASYLTFTVWKLN